MQNAHALDLGVEDLEDMDVPSISDWALGLAAGVGAALVAVAIGGLAT
jgi:hypothetical protein